MKKKKSKWWIGILVAGLFIGGYVVYFLNQPNQTGIAQIPTAEAKKGDIEVRVNGPVSKSICPETP